MNNGCADLVLEHDIVVLRQVEPVEQPAQALAREGHEDFLSVNNLRVAPLGLQHSRLPAVDKELLAAGKQRRCD